MRFISSAISCIVVTCLLSSFPATSLGQEIKGMKEELQLEGEQLKLVDVALEEFRKSNLNSVGYKLSVYSTANGYVAIFEDSNIAPGQRGSSPAMLSFGVEIGDDYKVIRSNFLR